jgi:hypothetical protein
MRRDRPPSIGKPTEKPQTVMLGSQASSPARFEKNQLRFIHDG